MRPHAVSPPMAALHARFSLTHETINRTLATIDRLAGRVRDKPLSIDDIGSGHAFKVGRRLLPGPAARSSAATSLLVRSSSSKISSSSRSTLQKKVTGAWINFQSRCPAPLPVVVQVDAGPSKTIAAARKKAMQVLRKKAQAQRRTQQKSRTKRPRGATQSAMRRRDVNAHDTAVAEAGEDVLPGVLRKRVRGDEAASNAESDVGAPMAETAAARHAAKKSKALADDGDDDE